MYKKYQEFAHAEAEVEMGPHFTNNSYFPRPRVAEAKLGKYAFENAAQFNDVAIVTLGRKSGEGGDRLISDFDMYPDEIEPNQGRQQCIQGKGQKGNSHHQHRRPHRDGAPKGIRRRDIADLATRRIRRP